MYMLYIYMSMYTTVHILNNMHEYQNIEMVLSKNTPNANEYFREFYNNLFVLLGVFLYFM